MSGSVPQRAGEADVQPAEFLRRLGEAGNGPHDIALAALMLSALDHPGKKLTPYRAHLAEIAEAAKAAAGFSGDPEMAARALSSIIAGRYGYDGARGQYDDPANADLMTVIDRRCGLPVALGILYIHAARAAGFESSGLFAPGHFLLKVGRRGSEAVIDAFNGGAALDRGRLSMPRPPRLPEPPAADEPGPLEPVGDTDVLLRLLNNARGRAVKARDTERAIEIGGRMALIAPKRASLWLELGRLQESAGSLSAARVSFENSLKHARAGDPYHNEAALALAALKRRLN